MWLLLVRAIFRLSLPGVLALGSLAVTSVQQLIFLLSISADGKESPLPPKGSSQSFGFSLVRWFVTATICHPVSHSLSIRSPSTNICFSFNGQPKLTQFFVSFLTVNLWRLANSRTGNSSNLISIFSVGHHVTIYI